MKMKTKHNLYKTWTNMIARCLIPGASRYKDYGGRGITVCDRWRNSFDAFVEDMKERPNGFSIDRIDVNGNYEPTNCRWASRSEQARNSRKTRIVEIEGTKYHVADLEDRSGISMKTIYYRASKGWPLKRVLSKKPQWNNIESQKKATAAHAAWKSAKTHCKRGHELTPENIYLYGNRRCCIACRRATSKFLYYGKKRPITDFL